MDKNENIVHTRGRHISEWGIKGYDTSVIGRQKKGKKHEILFFSRVAKVCLF